MLRGESTYDQCCKGCEQDCNTKTGKDDLQDGHREYGHRNTALFHGPHVRDTATNVAHRCGRRDSGNLARNDESGHIFGERAWQREDEVEEDAGKTCWSKGFTRCVIAYLMM